LEAFSAVRELIMYSRAAGALEAFATDLLGTIYKKSTY